MIDKLIYKFFGLLDKFIIASGKILFSRSKSDKKKNKLVCFLCVNYFQLKKE